MPIQKMELPGVVCSSSRTTLQRWRTVENHFRRRISIW